MATTSYPAVGDNGFSDEQWATMYGSDDGIVEDYHLTGVEACAMLRNNTTNRITIRPGKVKVNGYVLDIVSDTELDAPDPGAGTAVYTIAAQYDPALNVADENDNASEAGPCRLIITASPLDTSGDKKYTLIRTVSRTAGQQLSSAPTVDYRRWLGPYVTVPVRPTTNPVGWDFPRGSVIFETSTGFEWRRLPNAAGTALEWVNVTTPAKILFPTALVSGPAVLTAPPRVMREGGRVFCEGTLQRSSGFLNNGTSIVLGTLPVGYRPIGQRFFAGWGSGGVVRLTVNVAGQVFMYDTGTVNHTYISIDPINFRAEA